MRLKPLQTHDVSQGNQTWTADGTIHGNLPIEFNVTLGYSPSSVMSTQLGALPHTLVSTGVVNVKVSTFHWADMVVFKR